MRINNDEERRCVDLILIRAPHKHHVPSSLPSSSNRSSAVRQGLNVRGSPTGPDMATCRPLHAGHMDDFTDFLNLAYSTLYNSSCFSDTLSNAQGIRLPDKLQLIPDGAMKPAVRVRQAGRPR